MTTPKQLIKEFKDASWLAQQQLDDLAGSIEDLRATHIEKLLEVMLDRRFSGDAWKERMRLGLFERLARRVRDPALGLPYARALGTASSGLRELLLGLLPSVDSADAHDELCRHLQSNDINLRQAVAQVLPNLAPQHVAERLHKMMKSPDFPGIQEALDVLVKIDPRGAIYAFEQIIQKGKPHAQIHALEYISMQGRGRGPETEKIILYALRSSSAEKVKVAAIEAYCRLCSEENFFEHIADFVESSQRSLARAALLGARRFRSKRALSVLERAFRKGPESISLTVLQALGEIGSNEVLPLLVKALGHSLLTVRTAAGDVLAQLGRTGKVETERAIIWLLRSRDANVRRMAADLARSVTDPQDKFWPKLLSFLLDEDWWVRERVMDTLMEMAGNQLTRFIVGYLSSESPTIRLFAVDILGRLKDPQSLGILVRTAQSDDDWWVREKAIESIAAVGDPRGIAYIIDIMNREHSLQWSCIQALERLGAREAAPHIALMLESPSSDIRLVSLRCLDSLRAFQHAPQVEPLLHDEDPEVRKMARDLLAQWKIRAAYGVANQDIRAIDPLSQLLLKAHEMEGEDLLLSPDRKAFIKRLGRVFPLSDHVFTIEQIRTLITPHLNTHQLEALEELSEIDFSYEIKEKALRFRAHIFFQQSGLSAVFRLLRNDWFRLDELGLPPVARQFGQWKDGLVVIGGPTGSGKTMTLAALIDDINQNHQRHIISLEDPIEIVHRASQSLINQREIGAHTRSFQRALRATLRQDPDVILIGEMRDLDTISFAITVADTGHLVFGTLHTVSADSTIDRLINVFPSNQQEQVRAMLSHNLRAVLCQNLVRTKDGAGRILATEIMINNDAIANLIRKGKTHQIPSVIASSREQGMQQMDQELLRLYQAGLVDAEEVYIKARNKKDFEWLVGGEDVAEQSVKKAFGQAAAQNMPPGQPGMSAPVGPPGAPAPAPQRPSMMMPDRQAEASGEDPLQTMARRAQARHPATHTGQMATVTGTMPTVGVVPGVAPTRPGAVPGVSPTRPGDVRQARGAPATVSSEVPSVTGSYMRAGGVTSPPAARPMGARPTGENPAATGPIPRVGGGPGYSSVSGEMPSVSRAMPVGGTSEQISTISGGPTKGGESPPVQGAYPRRPSVGAYIHSPARSREQAPTQHPPGQQGGPPRGPQGGGPHRS